MMVTQHRIGARTLCQILGFVAVLSALGGTAVVWDWVFASEANREERIWIGLLLTAVLWNRSWELLRETFMLYMEHREQFFPLRVFTLPMLSLGFVLAGGALFYWFSGLPLARFLVYYAFAASYLVSAFGVMSAYMAKRSVSDALS
jgi:hypothetical protein